MMSVGCKVAFAQRCHSVQQELDRILLSISRCSFEEKQKQPGQNCQIGYQVRGETPVLAGVTETAAGDVESANFCRNRREREDHDRRG
jgi:hypothetical protein